MAKASKQALTSTLYLVYPTPASDQNPPPSFGTFASDHNAYEHVNSIFVHIILELQTTELLNHHIKNYIDNFIFFQLKQETCLVSFLQLQG